MTNTVWFGVLGIGSVYCLMFAIVYGLGWLWPIDGEADLMNQRIADIVGTCVANEAAPGYRERYPPYPYNSCGEVSCPNHHC